MHKSSISYYQNKINRIYGKNVIRVIKNFHRKHKIYLKMYVYPKHTFISKRADQAYHLQHYLQDNRAIRFRHAQRMLDKNYGKDTFTLLSYKDNHSLMTVRHNSPQCGYHISCTSAESAFTVWGVNTPCEWCRKHPNYSDAYFNFAIGRVTCGQYTYLGKRTIKSPTKHATILQIKLRHNCQQCNYHTYWISISHFFDCHRRCSICAHKLHGQQSQLSNDQFLERVLKKPYNHNAEFIPASPYAGWKHRMLWWHMTLPEPHLFMMTPNDFMTGTTVHCPYDVCSRPEYYALKWVLAHHLYVGRDFDFGHPIKHGYLKGLHYDFLFTNHTAVEIQGGQHMTVLWNENHPIQKFHLRQHRDHMKAFYSFSYGINLFHVRAYKWIYHSMAHKHPYTTGFDNSNNLKRCIWSQLDTLAPIILRGLPKKS